MTQPSVGDLIYLASYLIRVRVSAQSTPPDTPNCYSADFHVMGDQGAMILDALAGPAGRGGLQEFAFRQQDDANVNSSADLPTNLTDTPQDIGKYFLIDTVNPDGIITGETAWTWYGTGWRQFQMGVVGPPGPVPAIQVEEQLIPPGQDAHVETSGPTIEPSWILNLPQPAGPTGPVGPLHNFPDIDTSSPPVTGDLLTATGEYNAAGQLIWAGQPLAAPLPAVYSMPETAFTAYTGAAQSVLIGSYPIPAQPFDFTPVIWGHLGGTLQSTGAFSNAAHNLGINNANGGSFNLGFGGLTTPQLPWNATAQQIEDALANLANVGIGNIVATLGGVGNYAMEFVNALGGQALDPIIVNGTQLLPAGVASAVTSVIDSGGNPITAVSNTVQHVAVSAFGGSYQLLFTPPGAASARASTPITTAAIPFDAPLSVIQTAIDNAIGVGQAVVTQGTQDLAYFVEFVGGLAGQLISTIGSLVHNLIPPVTSSVTSTVTQVGGMVGAAVNQMISGGSLRIGCRVLLGDPTSGPQIARGLGNILGVVNIMPHYSTNQHRSDAITPTNQRAVVAANHTATIYINLWNDGAIGVYDFAPHNAQLFIMASPINPKAD